MRNSRGLALPYLILAISVMAMVSITLTAAVQTFAEHNDAQKIHKLIQHVNLVFDSYYSEQSTSINESSTGDSCNAFSVDTSLLQSAPYWQQSYMDAVGSVDIQVSSIQAPPPSARIVAKRVSVTFPSIAEANKFAMVLKNDGREGNTLFYDTLIKHKGMHNPFARMSINSSTGCWQRSTNL